MSITPWEFVNNCQAGSESLEGYSVFLTNRTLSSNFRMIGVLRIMNSYEWSGVPDNIRASITSKLIKTNPRFPYRYVKNAKIEKIWKDDDVEVVCFRMNCSPTDAVEYIKNGFFDKKQLDLWKAEGIYR